MDGATARITHIDAREHHPFTHAVRAGDWLYVSGQASTDFETMQIVPGTFAEEFDRTMENLRRVLAMAGAGLEDVVKVVGMVKDDADLAEYNQRYLQAFPHPRPARTTHVGSLTRIKVELECVAYLGRDT